MDGDIQFMQKASVGWARVLNHTHQWTWTRSTRLFQSFPFVAKASEEIGS